MNNTKSYLKLFFSFSVGTWINALLSLVTTPVVTFLLSPNEFGKASMYSLVYNALLLLVQLGADQYFVRFFFDLPQEKRMRLLWDCMWPGFFSLLFVSILLIVLRKSISVLILDTYDIKIIYILILSLFTGHIQRFNMLSIRMKKRAFLYSFINVMTNLFSFLTILLFTLLVSRTFYAAVIGQIVANIGAFLIGVFFELDFWKPLKVEKRIIKEVLLYSLPFVPTFLLTWIYQSIDRFTLRMMTTFSEIGLYTVAFKLASVMSIVQSGFTTSWVPIAYERYYSSQDKAADFYVKANNLISFCMLLAGVLLILSKDIFFLVVAQEYRNAKMVAPFLILGPVMYTISETTVIGINFVRKTHWHFWIALATAATNFFGNLVLVPFLGAKGAAISTGLSYVFFFSLRTFFSEKVYYCGFDVARIYIGTGLLIVQSFFTTIFADYWVNVITGLAALVGVLIVYKDQLYYVFIKIKTRSL